jgi:hypothetical protein
MDSIRQIECRKGRPLAFKGCGEANGLPRRDYLTRVWDMALTLYSACT